MISLVLVLAVVGPALAWQCNPRTCSGSQHTMCKYRSAWPAATCGKVQSSYLTWGEINEILRAHNDKRAFVARGAERRGTAGPQPGGRIPPLRWDNELAQIAQRWANQCHFGHDSCRNVDRFQVGQNVAKTMHSNGHRTRMSALVQMWYDEVKDFNKNNIWSFQWQSWPQIGHYTQLVWGKTTSVGCGAIRYKGWDNWYSTYLVCNYGPSGNWIGQRVY